MDENTGRLLFKDNTKSLAETIHGVIRNTPVDMGCIGPIGRD